MKKILIVSANYYKEISVGLMNYTKKFCLIIIKLK